MRRSATIATVFALISLSCAMLPGEGKGAAEPSRPVAAGGRILRVGPGERYEKPSEAARAARAGDTVEIQPGTYFDCAIWRASDLTIIGIGDVLVRDGSCEDKAIFVTKGRNITVRGVTFTGAHATDHNGAGIRAEGADLTVEASRFIDNEEGILSSFGPGTITIRNSYFRGNGNCIQACAHGIYIGHIDRLIVEHCEFLEQHVGHHVKSRALRTELTDNLIRDGAGGNSSYLVDIPDGGDLVMARNTLEKGPLTENSSAAVSIGAESQKNPTSEIRIEDNVFLNRMASPTSFVRNKTQTPALLRRNALSGEAKAIEGPVATGTEL